MEQGEGVIKTDLLAQQARLTDRQAVVLRRLVEQGSLAPQELETLFPDVSRRTLQRDIKALEEAGLIVAEGETNRLNYRPAKEL